MPGHMISTLARRDHCFGCATPTLVALDEGIRVVVDADPIGKVGTLRSDLRREIATILAGGTTYVLTRYGDLVHRDQDRIAGKTPKGTIHAAHRCPTRTWATDLLDLS